MHLRHHPRNLTCLLFVAFLTLLAALALVLVEFGPTVAKEVVCTAVFDETSKQSTYPSNDTKPRARQVDARSLIAAVAEGKRVSAQLIHQSWKTHNVLPSVAPLADSWRLTYPHWEYVLWDNADNMELVRVLYPTLLPAYQSLPREIYRADFIRNLYMHAFGGIYADLDSEAVSSLEPLLAASAARISTSGMDPVAFIGQMVTSSYLAHEVPNAFFAATQPGHPFWLVPIQYSVNWTKEWMERKSVDELPASPEYVTGPVALRYSLFLYASPDALPHSETSPNTKPDFVRLTQHSPLPPLSLLPTRIAPNATALPVVLLPPEIIYPYTWDTARPQLTSVSTGCVCWLHMRTFNREKCKSQIGARWVVNYWGHGW